MGKELEVKKGKERQFFELAKKFRGASNPQEVKRLGEKVGRLIFDKS